MFAPAGAVWSLDSLRRRGGAVRIPPWSVRLMQIQLCVMYFFTGVSKLGDGLIGNDWITGEAVYWVLNDLSLTRWPYYYLPCRSIVCRFLSWGTLAFELGFAFVMAMPRRHLFGYYDLFVLLAGVALHLGILVHTEVGWFSPATLCWYVLFLSGKRMSFSRDPEGRRV